MAHEIQHGVQVDKGQLGFFRSGGGWQDWFTDVGDEVGAWDAGLRQATPSDRLRGPLSKYGRATDKAEFLIGHGYGHYGDRDPAPRNAPAIPGFAPGTVVRTANWFYRTPSGDTP